MQLRSRVLLIATLLLAPLALAGTSATLVDPLAGYPEDSYVMENGDIAIPLGRPTPADYTPEIHEKVLAAGVKGMGYDPVADEEVPLSATQFLFIRPGSWMYSPSWCTMNFIYGTPGKYAIGSAGHCNAVGQPVILLTTRGPGALTPLLVNVGTTSASHDNGVGDDWSITPINANMQAYVDTDAAIIGGPTGGAYTGPISLLKPQAVKHIGHGLVIGTGGTPRAGLAIGAVGSAWNCACEAAPGDSGSAVILATGQGLGVLTHLVVGTGGPVAGTRLTAIPYTIADGDGDQITPM